MGDDLGFQFNSHEKRKEIRDETLQWSSYDLWLQLTWPVSCMEMREETRSDAQQPLSAISATGDVNESPVRGNFNAVFQWIIFFPQLLSRYKTIELLLKSKQFFTKRLLSLRSSSLSLEIKAVNIFNLSSTSNWFLTLKYKFPL